MSGGHFDYNQYRLEELACEVERLIQQSPDKDWYKFGPKTLARFQETVLTLRRAGDMLQRINWLVSGDDSEETFNCLWNENNLSQTN